MFRVRKFDCDDVFIFFKHTLFLNVVVFVHVIDLL